MIDLKEKINGVKEELNKGKFSKEYGSMILQLLEDLENMYDMYEQQKTTCETIFEKTVEQEKVAIQIINDYKDMYQKEKKLNEENISEKIQLIADKSKIQTAYLELATVYMRFTSLLENMDLNKEQETKIGEFIDSIDGTYLLDIETLK